MTDSIDDIYDQEILLPDGRFITCVDYEAWDAWVDKVVPALTARGLSDATISDALVSVHEQWEGARDGRPQQSAEGFVQLSARKHGGLIDPVAAEEVMKARGAQYEYIAILPGYLVLTSPGMPVLLSLFGVGALLISLLTVCLQLTALLSEGKRKYAYWGALACIPPVTVTVVRFEPFIIGVSLFVMVMVAISRIAGENFLLSYARQCRLHLVLEGKYVNDGQPETMMQLMADVRDDAERGVHPAVAAVKLRRKRVFFSPQYTRVAVSLVVAGSLAIIHFGSVPV